MFVKFYLNFNYMNNQDHFKSKIGKFDLVCTHENHSIKFRAECLHEGNIL
jgi:hypothetical protein